jgi:NADH-quinone oxidoreductase subunit N
MELPTLESINLAAVVPLLVLLGWALIVLVIDLFIPLEHKRWTAWLSIAGLLASAVLLIAQIGGVLGIALPATAFGGMLAVDGFADFLQIVFVISGAISVLLAVDYLALHGIHRGEYYTLLLFSTAGMMLMALANDLVVVFVALELLTIPLYILSGFARPRLDSEESAMKYFLLGAFSSAFLTFGVALVYGGTGTTALAGILEALRGTAISVPLVAVGMVLILTGLGFKVAAVPFHMWTPDVYQGAPTPVTAFMSVGAKAGGFAAMLRVLVAGMPTIADQWGTIVAVIAMLTMILGNVVAISQGNIKRMLAYSSIAHAGYVLLAVAAAQRPETAPLAVSAAIFYLLTYTFTNLGAFAVVIAVEHPDGSGNQINDFAGLGRTHPWLALAMTLFMLSLTGLPVSAGLVGKFFVFQAAIQAAASSGWMLAAAIVGVVTSVISAFYYIRVVLVMYMREGAGEAALKPALAAGLLVTALATLIVGIIPTPLFELAREALMMVSG